MANFIPPMHNPLILGLAAATVKTCCWWGYFDSIDIAEDDLERLSSLKDKRAILCPNHCHAHDPGIIYHVQELLHERFHYIAAREIFERGHGILGWLIQRIGAYSVERGVVDRQSIAATLDILTQQKSKLVVFPEGDISYRNDRVLDVQPGLAGLFLHAATAVSKEAPGEPLYVVPMALCYRYARDISRNLSNALLRIELALELKEHRASLITRFESARQVMLERMTGAQEKQSDSDKYGRNSRFDALQSFDDLGWFSQDDLASGIDLIELELFNRVTQKGHRTVQIKVAPPRDLVQRVDAFKRNKRRESEALAGYIEDELREMLGITEFQPRIAA